MRDPLAPQLGRPHANDAVVGHGVRRAARMVRFSSIAPRQLIWLMKAQKASQFLSLATWSVLQPGSADVLRRGEWILEDT